MVLVCRAYAADESGRFPDSFDELVPDYVDWRFWEKYDSAPWVLQPGLRENAPPETPLIWSTQKIRGHYLVGLVGGQVIQSKERPELAPAP